MVFNERTDESREYELLCNSVAIEQGNNFPDHLSKLSEKYLRSGNRTFQDGDYGLKELKDFLDGNHQEKIAFCLLYQQVNEKLEPGSTQTGKPGKNVEVDLLFHGTPVAPSQVPSL